MPEQLNRVLIVAFRFPPYAAVGGKRWAKLSKYLARLGIEVHVLTVRWPGGDQDTLRDVTDSHIHIHRIPSLALNRLAPSNPRSLPARVWNRIYRAVIAGHPRSQDATWWGPAVVPAAAWIARRHHVDAVIVTGGPFMANYWLARAKPLLGGIPLVQEFRDPWADLPDEALSSQGDRKRVEHLERRVIESANAIVTVTDGLSALIRTKADATPVHTISNGYDPDDLPAERLTRPRPFRLIHGGNLYVGRQEPLRYFLSVVRKLAEELPGLELVFRGKFPADVRRDFTDLEETGILAILPPVSAQQFAIELDSAFAALQFNAQHFPYLVSTKIYEYAASGRPVISVNYGGEIARLVDKHGLGWSVDATSAEAMSACLREVYTRWTEEPGLSLDPAEFDAYAYPETARDYSGFLTRTARQ